MVKYFFLVLMFSFSLFNFCEAQKMNSTEEQIFRSEAVKFIQNFYAELPLLLPKLNDSIPKSDENEQGKPIIKKVTNKDVFIDKFFPNHDIYVHNDLSPDDEAKRTDKRVMTIEEYLPELKRIYDNKKEKLVFTLKSALGKEVRYNGQAQEAYYFVKIEIERKLKGAYLGLQYTENVKALDIYVRTLDKPDTKLLKFSIIGIDFKSRQIKEPGAMTMEEATAQGLKFFDEEEFEKAYKYLNFHSKNKKFARNSNASWAMAYMNFWGRGTEKNDKEMVKWLDSSADRDNLYALYFLGENYFFGEYGVEENEKKGLKYIRSAAKKGLAEAQYSLGEKYEKGQGGLKPDKKDAKYWYEKASKQGHAKAKAALKALNATGGKK
ncbi:MAG: sel1 repeat family protein [Bacteroidetes bacterium]|nr:MAG: sel1 repeat family protein [Bacteroidota bacterium]TAG90326.1 MAG: sel1 repeat family protein [Bacteroidota bacterium]